MGESLLIELREYLRVLDMRGRKRIGVSIWNVSVLYHDYGRGGPGLLS